ncbi:hypothetical protein Hanom_Chr08g00725451 [Helianthus anomalus]
MEDFKPKHCKWFIKEEGKKKKSKKVTPKKVVATSSSKPQQKKQLVQRMMIDEPSDDEPQHDENVETENVKGDAENVKGDESSSSSGEIALIQIALTTGDPRAKWQKKDKAQKKRNNTDDEDATYELSGPEIQKISKGRKKRPVKKIDSPALKQARKSIVKAVKVTIIGSPIQREAEVIETTTTEPFVVLIQT